MNGETHAGFERILGLYEDFRVDGAQCLPHEYQELCYVAPDNIHSSVSKTGYGVPKARWCVRLSGGGHLSYKVELKGVRERRHYIKLICALENWRVLNNDLALMINGRAVHASDQEFVENVCQGWPALYYEVDGAHLQEGVNEITVSTCDRSGAGLLISEISVVSLPAAGDYQQVSARRSVRLGDSFSVALNLPQGESPEIELPPDGRYSFEGLSHSGGCTILHFTASAPGQSGLSAFLPVSGERVELIMPEVVPASPDRCLVGMDSDDHRHDLSSEADRIPRVFALSAMGDFLQFRPAYSRTHLHFAPEETWRERIAFLTDMDISIGIADTRANVMGFVPEAAGAHYVGCHIHEPYLYFCLPLEKNERLRREFHLDAERVLNAESFGQAEDNYMDSLRKTRAEYSTLTGRSSVGSPSLLCMYEARAGFERVTLEPVGNVNLLTAAGRGVSRDRCQWGAHVPVDWYFGSPTDDIKSRKFRLALNYMYMSGAEYLYSENSLFKTNAFSREDWEGSYCARNRQYLREFYDYVTRSPREGELVVDSAVIYGRHEHFYWYHDDRMAELKDMGDWDRNVWGKWADDSHRRCWRALDAWLPAASSQTAYQAPENLELFSGTPYGNVDVIPWDGGYSGYRNLALLGWNTMNEEMLERLMAFVREGGTLFLSHCHLNMTDRSDAPMSYIRHDELSRFLGVEVKGQAVASGGVRFSDGHDIPESCDGVKIALCAPVTASVIAEDSSGRGIFYANEYGRGRVYYGAFMEYFSEDWSVRAAAHVMDIIGRAGRASCDNPNVAFAERRLSGGGAAVDVLNMNCALSGGVEEFTIKVDGHEIRGAAREGAIQTYTVRR